MGGRRRRSAPPIPTEPIDLLAGLAPGVELAADEVPAGVGAEADAPQEATLTVAEAGRMLRTGDGTIRRLIRTTVLRPDESAGRRRRGVADDDRAGVVPRTRQRPGE